MAGSMVPYSNPAGNNQTSPPTGGSSTVPRAIALPGSGTVAGSSPAENPLIPATSTLATASGGTAVGNITDGTGEQKQLTDIYGKGTGEALDNLINSIGGTNSATLQEYSQSLAPQEATAQANLDASLGAGGVSANSSVATLGNANLQAQETAAIAGEDAQLTQSGQNLQAQLLTGTEADSAKEVASSGWDVFGSVLEGLGGLAGDVVGAAGKAGGFSDLFS